MGENSLVEIFPGEDFLNGEFSEENFSYAGVFWEGNFPRGLFLVSEVSEVVFFQRENFRGGSFPRAVINDL